jgi:acyl carrier protein
METEQIRAQIKQSISTVTGIEPADIADNAAYRDDLGLDSLSILEVAINVEFAYKVEVPEEELKDIRTIDDTIAVIQRHLAARTAVAA